MKQQWDKRGRLSVLTGTLSVLLVGCGGAGSGGGSVADGGIRGTGSSVGPVSGFGSVFVNGVRFETDGRVSSDDGLGREDQLSEGMIVRIRGEWRSDDQGVASDVRYDDTLRGPLSAASWDDAERTGSLTVLDQSVVLDGQTVFRGADPVTLASAPADYVVRVSGWRQADGRFRASYVGARGVAGAPFDDLTEVEIEGDVANLTQETFTLGGRTVVFGDGALDDDIESLENGLSVEVEGSLQSDGAILGSEIEPDDRTRYFGSDEDFELTGPVTEAAQNGQLAVSDIPVRIDDRTELDDDLLPADLQPGLLVSVEGDLSDDIVRAEEIKRREGDAELEASVLSIDRAAGVMNVGGVSVRLSTVSIITGDDDDRLTLSSLSTGDLLEIEGIQRRDEGGFLEALTIDRDDDDDEASWELEGRVSDAEDNAITVLGVRIQSNSVPSGLSAGDQVEVSYRQNAGGSFVASEIEVEDDDGSD
ncbi:hypothetical protein CF392_09185 [Tamilnaduibacter salinus]|uniref:DUF5666 domain-containing protein n=1 Tax=Tamilnaduibacter salinus TaxID=1484056 RepID=A0A2A2I3D9_9GAMM|nr:DUF5666 domain-containing protein [Tamilnaduibacter salinus]PAV25814.1 hypothetical protein CF392_09185 [Tamilnaduibacter salinus]